jgi:hypothetical protein
MSDQLDLFQELSIATEDRKAWMPGDLCDFTGNIFIDLESGGGMYAYDERCRLIEKRADGKWLAVIEMGMVWGHPWAKDGTKVILDEEDISEARDKPCYTYQIPVGI